jgi:hypothetical protein
MSSITRANIALAAPGTVTAARRASRILSCEVVVDVVDMALIPSKPTNFCTTRISDVNPIGDLNPNRWQTSVHGALRSQYGIGLPNIVNSDTREAPERLSACCYYFNRRQIEIGEFPSGHFVCGFRRLEAAFASGWI